MAQRNTCVAIGNYAGMSNQATGSVAIGKNAGESRQHLDSVAIGTNAAFRNQSGQAVAIGRFAGAYNQSTLSVAIGSSAGQGHQGASAVGIGLFAGFNAQNDYAVAVGQGAGMYDQGQQAVAVGRTAGNRSQGQYAVAIGQGAGQGIQGNNAVAIGKFAGRTNQHNNSIVLNASGAIVNSNGTDRFYVKPVRQAAGPSGQSGGLVYNSTSGEIMSDTAKTFIIDHPTNDEKYLVHACLEGPEAGVYYRGHGEITDGAPGTVTVNLPDYTKVFQKFTVHVTPILEDNWELNCLYASPVHDCKFTVSGLPVKFNWVVYAERRKIDTEPLKDSVNLLGSGPYKYIA